MLAPSISNLLTRWITKEGFAMTGEGSLMLGISFKDKKWKFYLLAIILPWILFECWGLLKLAVVPQAYVSDYYMQVGIPRSMVLVYPLSAIISACFISFAALGEEGGWRGYMMPKLINIMGLKKAILVGGIIWGVWHAPLTCIGHNFGKDYPGFPYLGILTMCVFCTFMGTVLTFLTIKTKSIWPATIMHAVTNASPNIIQFFIDESVVQTKIPNSIVEWVFLIGPVAIIAGICIVIMRKDN